MLNNKNYPEEYTKPTVFNRLSDIIGKTPLLKVDFSSFGVKANVYAKLEYLNPGLSVKDRPALNVLKQAEAEGRLKPGGTIIECTSGNMGVGLIMASKENNYKCIFVMTTKHSKEKIKLLRAYGAEVVVCDGSLPKDHADSAHGTAARLERELDNACWINQYQNQNNPNAHYLTTGPEICEQTQGKITHFISSSSTGGTISGVGSYLKEKKPDVKVWAADAFGSAFKAQHENGVYTDEDVYPYLSENVGKNYIPETINFDVIDHFEKVPDVNGAVTARLMAYKFGLLLGYSSGACFASLLQQKHKFTENDTIVVLCADHGSRYMNTIYNDDWMLEHDFPLSVENLKIATAV